MFRFSAQRTFEQEDAYQARYLASLPVCSVCGQPIDSDYYFNVYGELFCEECMEKVFRHYTEDYMEVGDEY